MKQEKKYTNMCKYDSTETKELKTSLTKYFSKNENGTVIIFKASDDLLDVIRLQFEEKPSLANNERLGIFFGMTNIDIELADEKKERKKLSKYNYFKGQRKDFYIKDKYNISICYDEVNNTYRFIAETKDENKNDKYIEKKFEKKWSTKTLNDNDLKKINFFSENNTNKVDLELRIGLRKDKQIFDEKTPFDIANKTDENKHQHNAVDRVVSYDADFFSSTEEGFSSAAKSCGLIRNSLYISDIRIDNRKRSNARAGFKELIKNNLLKWTLEYTTESSQDSFIDKCLGIQQNKNQHNGEFPDKQLKKLIEHLYDLSYKKLIDKFTDIYAKYKEEEEEDGVTESEDEVIEEDEEVEDSNIVENEVVIEEKKQENNAVMQRSPTDESSSSSENNDDVNEEIKEPITHQEEEEMPSLESTEDVKEMLAFIKYVKGNKSKHMIKEYIKHLQLLLQE